MTKHDIGKYIIVVFLIVGISLTAITITANLGRRPPVDDEPTHDVILLAPPTNYTYYLEIGYYSTEDDAYADQNWYTSVTSIVRTYSEERRESVLYGIPKALDSVWLRISYFEEGEDQDLAEFVVLLLTMGSELRFHFEEHDFTILVTPITD